MDDGIIKYRHKDLAKGRRFLEGIEIARKAVEAATEKQASDIVLLDVSKVCSFADYFVICSGDSDRQLAAICDEIEHTLKRAGSVPIHHEGTSDSGWMLSDYGDVLIHVFAPAQRAFYQLDELWNQAIPVVRIQ